MKWFHNLRTRAKLISGFVVMSVMMVAIGVFALGQLEKVNRQTTAIAVDWMPSVRLNEKMRGDVHSFGRDELQHLLSVDTFDMGNYERFLDATSMAIAAEQRQFEKLINSDHERELYQAFESSWSDYQKVHVQVVSLSRQKKTREALALVRGEAGMAFMAATDNLDSLVALSVTGAEMARASADAIHRSSLRLILASVGLALVLAAVLAITLGNAIIGSIARGVIILERVSEALAAAAGELASAATEISTGAQEQASGLEETASSLEEITATVRQNADNAQQANALASGARDVAEKGGRVVGEAVGAMTEINQSSKQIADIITTIDEIAFQTNLLALNAAVEAARAGEQGRGFAVVAAEVRNLAQRSAAAAKEIKGLIKDSVRKVENGSSLVNQSGQALQEIVTSVKRVTDIVGEIAAASREQASGVDQVNRSVSQMDTVTQSNASQTEEMAGTAETLGVHARDLQQVVERLKAEHGVTGHPAPEPQPETANPAPPAPIIYRRTPPVARVATNGKSRTNGKPRALSPAGRISQLNDEAGPTHGAFEEF